LTIYAESASYHHRQLFIHMAYSILPELHDFLYALLLQLSKDSISNVRVTLAKRIVENYDEYYRIIEEDYHDRKHRDEHKLLCTLHADSNKDVRDILNPLSLAVRLDKFADGVSKSSTHLKNVNGNSDVEDDVDDELAAILGRTLDDTDVDADKDSGEHVSGAVFIDRKSSHDFASPENYALSPSD